MILENWIRLAVNIAQVIAPIIVAISLAYVVKTFYRTKKADEIKLTESIFKDLRTMLQELHSKNENFDYKDWKSRFLSTLEWFSSLVNNNEIPFKLAKRFFKESIIEWYNQFLLSEPDKEDPNKYRELKELYKKFIELYRHVVVCYYIPPYLKYNRLGRSFIAICMQITPCYITY